MKSAFLWGQPNWGELPSIAHIQSHFLSLSVSHRHTNIFTHNEVREKASENSTNWMRRWMKMRTHWCAVSGLKVESKRELWNREANLSNAHISEWVTVAAELHILQAKREGVLTEEVVERSGILIPISLEIIVYYFRFSLNFKGAFILLKVSYRAALANFNSM